MVQDEDRLPESPLYSLLKGAETDQYDREAKTAESWARAEDLIFQCMAAQGFDYYPRPMPSGIVDTTPVAPSASYDAYLAKAENEGFGLSALEEQVSVGPSNESDRNQEYLLSLGPGDQRAYNLALYGNAFLSEGLVDLDEIDKGCSISAIEEVFSPIDSDLARLLVDAESELAADPQLEVARIDWHECVAAAGFGWLVDPDSIGQSVANHFSQPGSSDLLPFERDVAVATARCNYDYEAAKWNVRVAIEQEIVARDGDRIALAIREVEGRDQHR